MHKIVTLYQRNYDGDRLVRNEVTPGAEWVLRREGVATVKVDGTSCFFKDGVFHKRYDVRKGKTPPSGFIPAQPEPDEVTGHWPGWVPVGDGPEDRWHREAWENTQKITYLFPWTYELIGPKIQGNPYNLSFHVLVAHASIEKYDVPPAFDSLRAYLTPLAVEGIVWWRDIQDPNCEKVKIKRKDFGLEWPIK